MDEELTTMPERFVWARKRKKDAAGRSMSQVELAGLLKVSQQSIEKLENGHVTKPRYLPEAADILGVNYEWLLNGTGEIDAVDYVQISEEAKRYDDFRNSLGEHRRKEWDAMMKTLQDNFGKD